MAGERKIWRNTPMSFDGHRIGTGASKVEAKIGRERLPYACFEDPGTFSDKGNWNGELAIEGYGTEAETRLMSRLADDAEDDTSFVWLLEGNTQSSPHAATGQPAILMTVRTFNVSTTAEPGKIKSWNSEHALGDGRRPFFVKVLHTNQAKAPNPAGAGVVTSTPITLPALTAGYEAVFSLHCTKITGTGNVTLVGEILSDTPGFASPLVRATFPTITNDVTPPPGELLGPKSATVFLDGDATPIPSETQWAVRLTVTDTDTDAAVEWIVVGVIQPKFT